VYDVSASICRQKIAIRKSLFGVRVGVCSYPAIRVREHAVVLPLALVLAAASRGRKHTESTAIMRHFLIVSGS